MPRYEGSWRFIAAAYTPDRGQRAARTFFTYRRRAGSRQPEQHSHSHERHHSDETSKHWDKPFSSKQPLTTLASGTLPIYTHQKRAVWALDLRISRRLSSVITGPHVD